jgi:hypothetical protein
MERTRTRRIENQVTTDLLSLDVSFAFHGPDRSLFELISVWGLHRLMEVHGVLVGRRHESDWILHLILESANPSISADVGSTTWFSWSGLRRVFLSLFRFLRMGFGDWNGRVDVEWILSSLRRLGSFPCSLINESRNVLPL